MDEERGRKARQGERAGVSGSERGARDASSGRDQRQPSESKVTKGATHGDVGPHAPGAVEDEDDCGARGEEGQAGIIQPELRLNGTARTVKLAFTRARLARNGRV